MIRSEFNGQGRRLFSVAVLGGLFLTLPASALDLLLINGKVYTVNSAQPWVEAIGVEDGLIRFLGSSEQAQALLIRPRRSLI